MELFTNTPFIISAPHSGQFTASYTYKEGAIALAAKAPVDLVDGVIAFARSGFTTPGTRDLSITATGPGGSKVVSVTVNVVVPPPQPPADFGGPVSIVLQ